MGEQRINGSPVRRFGQLQIGLWLMTSHFAPIPHVPGQGFLHFWLLHASFWAHSELTTHSGLHVGGLPIYPGTQEHTAWPLISRHWLLGPHGDGWHGCVTIGSVIQKIILKLKKIVNFFVFFVCFSKTTVPLCCLHSTNGLPENPGGQLHIGTWFTTSHRAFWPHVPGQGSLHFWRMHARSRLQSWLNTHSGRQPIYGSPWNSGRHVHSPLSHRVFEPHGDGLQGSDITGSTRKNNGVKMDLEI